MITESWKLMLRGIVVDNLRIEEIYDKILWNSSFL